MNDPVAILPRRDVELFGLCGVGKSTILQDLVPALRKSGGPLSPPSIETPVVPDTAAYRRELLRILVHTGVRAPGPLAKLLTNPVGLWLPRKLAYRIAGLRQRPQTGLSLLIDSSVLQPFVSFTIEENINNLAIPSRALFVAIPKPACAIYVRASADTAIDRYKTRQKSISAPLIENGLKQRFQDGLAMCDWLCKACHEIDVPVLVLDVEERLKEGAIEDFAERLLCEFKPAEAN